MVVEASLMIEKGNGSVGATGYKVVKKKKCNKVVKRKMKRQVEVVPRTLQMLFHACGEVFKGYGTVLSPDDVQRLSCILDNMVPEDVGLSRSLQFFNPESVADGSPRVTYTTIYKCDNFSMCIFFLPATGVIPLHNHPEMTVFSKLLLGSMHIKAYDWVDIDNSNNPEKYDKPRLASLKANEVFTAPCNTSVLYPTSGGNIHEFRAVTPCAVLDVLGPPYSKDDGRDCSYYRDFPFSAFPNDKSPKVEDEAINCGWLEEIEVPEESEMDVIKYMGPPVY
ncbi:hypothetical protein LIER_38385 [Lithospermum erythrorhizon]|uniref:cysteine dioxygenase n=1 Tax=Lithospermum erythrorhizon TaxID=34254 RepID=A0AAV3Q456_LITER